MDLLTFATLCAVGAGAPRPGCPAGLFFGPPAAAALGTPWRDFIDEASARFGIPAVWIHAVMLAESDGRPHRDGTPITSPAGAMGLMQIMPATYAELRQRHGLGADPYDPRDNILAGTAYLREMLDRFGTPGFLAAYNAGPERMADALAGRRALPAETRRYLARLAPLIAAGPGPISASGRPNGGLFFAVRPARNAP